MGPHIPLGRVQDQAASQMYPWSVVLEPCVWLAQKKVFFKHWYLMGENTVNPKEMSILYTGESYTFL